MLGPAFGRSRCDHGKLSVSDRPERPGAVGSETLPTRAPRTAAAWRSRGEGGSAPRWAGAGPASSPRQRPPQLERSHRAETSRWKRAAVSSSLPHPGPRVEEGPRHSVIPPQTRCRRHRVCTARGRSSWEGVLNGDGGGTGPGGTTKDSRTLPTESSREPGPAQRTGEAAGPGTDAGPVGPR